MPLTAAECSDVLQIPCRVLGSLKAANLAESMKPKGPKSQYYTSPVDRFVPIPSLPESIDSQLCNRLALDVQLSIGTGCQGRCSYDTGWSSSCLPAGERMCSTISLVTQRTNYHPAGRAAVLQWARLNLAAC